MFGMLGALMFASKIIMEALPNIHLLGMFTVVFTAVYRKKALYPIYIFVLLTGVYAGFNAWWVPHLYLWTLLWGAVMLIPRRLPDRFYYPILVVLCALHGFLYGTLYAPAQAIMFGLSFEGMIAWIISGLPFDAIHGVSNFFTGFLILPLCKLLERVERYAAR